MIIYVSNDRKQEVDQQHFFSAFGFFSFFKAKLSVRTTVSFCSLSLISLARVMKLSSTLTLFLTEVETYLKQYQLYLILFLEHHSLISLQPTRFSRSLLLPTRIIMALSALVLQISYHCYFIFLKELQRDKSNTISTPWQPLKYVATIDRYFYCPAVSQMYNLAGLSFKLIFLILKSMVVTCVSFSARKSPSVKRQNSAVLPTLLSPTIIILYRFSSLLLLKYRSSIIYLNYNQLTTIKFHYSTNNYFSFLI